MHLIEDIQREADTLSTQGQREVLDFIRFLKSRPAETSAPDEQDSPLFRQLEESGFIGCIATDEQLSSTYKQQLDFSGKCGITQ
jgi:hypothetical protein